MITIQEYVSKLKTEAEKKNFRGKLGYIRRELTAIDDERLMAFGVPRIFRSSWPADFAYLAGRMPELGVGGLFVTGEGGKGKTRLAVALFRAGLPVFAPCLEGLGELFASARFVTAAHFVRLYGDAMRSSESGDLFEEFCRIGILVVDDVGAEYRSDWAVGLLAELIDARVSREVCTIVTSNLSLGEMAKLDPRTASRLETMPRFSFVDSDRNWRVQPADEPA